MARQGDPVVAINFGFMVCAAVWAIVAALLIWWLA